MNSRIGDFVINVSYAVIGLNVLGVIMFLLIEGCASVPQKAEVVETQQQGAVNVADLKASVDAALATFERTTNYGADVWLNRGIMGGVLAMAWWFARRHGYDAGRQRRLRKENNDG